MSCSIRWSLEIGAAADGPSALAYRRFVPQHQWHVYYLCSIRDGFSRYIVHWDLRESITEADIEIIPQGAKEKCPEARPRIISDNGPQFIAKDFKESIRISGTTHVRTSPFHPQSNGKIETLAQIAEERAHSARGAAVVGRRAPSGAGLSGPLQQRPPKKCHRLHHAEVMLAERQQDIHAEGDLQLEAARHQRQSRRQQAA